MQKYSNNGSDNFMRSGNIGNMNYASYNGYVNTGMADWSPRGNELSNYGYSGDSQRSAILNNSYRNSFATVSKLQVLFKSLTKQTKITTNFIETRSNSNFCF